MSEPRTAYAARNSTTRIHKPVRHLPCIIVPGVLASRLTDPANGELVWNPVGSPLGGSPGDFAINFKKLSQPSLELVPDETHVYQRQSQHEEVQHIRHFYNLVTDFYAPLAIKLAKEKFEVDGVQVQTKVYVAGYDWRQDNAKSALRVAQVVDEALAETGERQVLIFAHSMGTLVTRYYLRALGGERKCFALFHLAGPVLGTNEGYLEVKNGIAAAYLQEGVEAGVAGDWRTVAFEGISAAGNIAETFDGVLGFFGSLYLAFSFGAGKFLSRYESRYLLRQFAALYQTFPNQVYCARYPNWMVFDPLATGYPPVGKMLVFPTLLDGAIEATGELYGLFGDKSDAVVESFKEDATRFFSADPEEEFELTARATRNLETVGDKLKAIGEIGDSFGDAVEAAGAVQDILARVDKMFVDCRNASSLYSDIYTGMLDVVEWRSFCAANTAAALRFHHALTLHPSAPAPETPADLVMGLVGKLGGLIAGGGAASSGGGAPNLDPKALAKPTTTWWEKAVDRTKSLGVPSWYRSSQESRIDKKKKAQLDVFWSRGLTPKAYMHPRSYNVYCEDLATGGGCLLLPTDIESRDDSNVVEWEMIPDFLSQALRPFDSLPGWAKDLQRTALGDGRISALCANPEKDLLSNPFLDEIKLKETPHDQVPIVEDAVEFMLTMIREFLPEYLAPESQGPEEDG